MRKTNPTTSIALIFAAIFMPAFASATLMAPGIMKSAPPPELPAALSSYSRTATLQWGCPVADNVVAESPDQAVQKIRSECIEQVSREAARKPGVMTVLDTHVVYPDIKVEPMSDGFRLQGTFFLETVVLQQKKPGDR